MSLTATRNTIERPGNYVALPVAAATLIFLGSIAATDANGRAVPASDTAGLRAKGRAEHTADNSAGLDGAISLTIKRGVFLFANSSTQALTAADVGKLAFIEDDQTVAKTSTNLVVAGRVLDIEDAGVWVDFNDIPIRSGVAPASTNGTFAGAADLAAAKAEGEKVGDDVRAVIASITA